MRSFFSELRHLTDSGCDDLEAKLGMATKNVLAKRRSASAPTSASKKAKPGNDTFDSFEQHAIATLQAKEVFEVPTGVLTIDALSMDNTPAAIQGAQADDGEASQGALADDGAADAHSQGSTTVQPHPGQPFSTLMTIYSNLEIIDKNMSRVKVFNNYFRAVIFVLIQARLIEQRTAAARDGGDAFKTPRQQHIAASFQKMCQSMIQDVPSTGELQRVQVACVRAANTSVASLQKQVSDYLRFYEVIQKYPALIFVIPSYHGFNARLRAEFETGDQVFKACHGGLFEQLALHKEKCKILLNKLEANIVKHISLASTDL